MGFSFWDYAVFVFVNLLNILIGMYFGFYKKNKSTADYLTGARQMRVVPIGLSLLLGGISAITVMGLPTEIYFHGVHLLYCCFGYICASVLAAFLYVPVLHKLKITSSFEYFERRYDRRLRLIASVIGILQLIFFLPMAIYTPSVAINYGLNKNSTKIVSIPNMGLISFLVTQIDIHFTTPIFCLIGIIYTVMGGFRAVVWSDFLQAFVLFPSIFIIAAKGTYDIGFEKILEQSFATNRLELPIFDPNPTIRYSFWSLFIGGSFYYMYGIFLYQVLIQKYQSLPNIRDVRISIFICLLGLIVLIVGCGYNGLILHSYYYGCDPISNQDIKIHDQLLPSIAVKLFQNLPGFCGIFITGISSAALSSFAGGINSLSALILEDFYKTYLRKEITDQQSVNILRVISFIFGAIIILLVFLVEHLGSVYEVTYSLDAIFSGIMLSLLTIGIFLPWINAKAVSVGSIVGLCSVGWISFNAMYRKFNRVKLNSKPLSVEKCVGNISVVEEDIIEFSNDSGFSLYQISFYWYALIGCLITILASVLISLCIGWNDLSQMDSELISPYLHKYIPLNPPVNKIKGRDFLKKTNVDNVKKKNHEIEYLLQI